MDLLPKWKLTGTLPAFKDGESATAIEQTYKLYQAMEKLISDYNTFAESVNTTLSENETKFNQDLEIYATGLRQEFQDFIDVIDLKLSSFVDDEEEIMGLQSLVSDLTKSIENVRKDLQAQIDNIVFTNNEDEKVDDAVIQLINEKINSINSSISSLSSELSSAKSRITSLETLYNELDTRIKRVNTDFSLKYTSNTNYINNIDIRLKILENKAENNPGVTGTSIDPIFPLNYDNIDFINIVGVTTGDIQSLEQQLMSYFETESNENEVIFTNNRKDKYIESPEPSQAFREMGKITFNMGDNKIFFTNKLDCYNTYMNFTFNTGGYIRTNNAVTVIVRHHEFAEELLVENTGFDSLSIDTQTVWVGFYADYIPKGTLIYYDVVKQCVCIEYCVFQEM